MTPLPPLLQASVIIRITSLTAFSSSVESTVYQLIHSKANNFRIPSPSSSIKPGKAILTQRTIAHGICAKSYCCLPGVESREIGEHRVWKTPGLSSACWRSSSRRPQRKGAQRLHSLASWGLLARLASWGDRLGPCHACHIRVQLFF